MRNKITLLILFFFGILTTCFAIPYSAGGHIVDVEVRNSAMALVNHAKVRCYMSGKNIVVRATATGYLEERLSITPGGSPGFFKRDVVLKDLPKKLWAEDLNGKKIVSVYFVTDQYGFEAKEYGITAFIPREIWKNPTMKGVEVFDTFWGVPLKNSCTIEAVEGFYKVRMTISRTAMEWTGPELVVVFDTKVKVTPEGINRWLASLREVEGHAADLPKGAVGAFAEFLFHAIPRQDVENGAEGPIPISLKVLYEHSLKFLALHRDYLEE